MSGGDNVKETTKSSVSITEEELKKYFELNKQKKEIEQEMNQLKKQLHQFLDHSFGKDQKGEIERGNYKAQRQVRSSTSYNDENTIQKLEELNLEDFIVKRPDIEKIEAAIKLGLVEEKAFEECKITKLTQAIVVKESVPK
jgi:hypothetical protein